MELPGTVGPLEPYGSGRGYVDHIAPTSPAAGSGLVFNLDPTFTWRFLSVRFQVDTSATVASRFVTVDYTDPEGGVWVRNAAGVVLTASTVAQVFDFNAQRTVAEWATSTDVLAPLSDFFIPGGWQLRISLASIQAADAVTAIKLYAEKWVTGSPGEAIAAAGAASARRGGR